ncbi:flagellar hook-basal body protein [Sphingomonas sp. QA11]|uniref:flagellar hook-basal body protein n=1 Tax=Sphingomonas sp. QA11 TaxID=2950605 RepID=UPI00234AD40D|nr:flagellar hook basal-body protein [Sphingomonas sp. QA11]
MTGLVEAATAILSASERRLAAVSANISNVSTPGYKRQISFASLVSRDRADMIGGLVMRLRPDLAQGKMVDTGNPLDIAISGDGFFKLRDGNAMVYSRQGQFQLGANGAVVTPQGQVLQQAGGGDLVLEHAGVEILADGTVLDGDRPVARVGVFQASAGAIEAIDGSLFRLGTGEAEEVADPLVRQGMTEASNVSVGDEMVTMMAALRQAESGARLVQTYDDLLGRAITTFGQSGR